MLYHGQKFESPVPMENFFTEDGKWVFIKQSDHNKIMNYIKNTDPYEVDRGDNDSLIIKIDGLYYQLNNNVINYEYYVDSDEPK